MAPSKSTSDDSDSRLILVVTRGQVVLTITITPRQNFEDGVECLLFLIDKSPLRDVGVSYRPGLSCRIRTTST